MSRPTAPATAPSPGLSPQSALCEQRLRLVIDSALDAVILIDERGVITEWNPQVESAFGWARDEAIGRSLGQTIIPERYREAHTRGLQRFLASGEGPVLNQRIEIEALHRHGREFPVELTILPMQYRGGWIFSAFVRDITQRRQAQEALRASEQRNRATFATPAVGVCEVDLEGRLLRVNPRFCEITGYTEAELLSRRLQEITHPDDREVHEQQYYRVVAAQIDSCTQEQRCACKDGRIIWVSLSRSIVRDSSGMPRYGVGVVQDITPRKLAEQELTRYRDDLEVLVTERTHELEQSHQRLRLSERMAALGTLSAGLGHDMGNLLLPVRLRLDAMEAKGVSGGVRSFMKICRRSGPAPSICSAW